MRRAAHNPTVTAGLKCAPEIGPNASPPVSTVSPNASATPPKPIPSFGNAAARTALPHPPSTSQNVPMNSAIRRRESAWVIVPPPFVLRTSRPRCPEADAASRGSSRFALRPDRVGRSSTVRYVSVLDQDSSVITGGVPRGKVAGIAIALSAALTIAAVADRKSIAPGHGPAAVFAQLIALSVVDEVVHGVLIVMVGALLFGLTVFSMRRGLHREHVLAGLIAYALAP